MLLTNLKQTPSLSYLIQNCKDDVHLTFSESAAYIRMNAIVLAHDQDATQHRRTVNTLMEESPTTSHALLTWKEATELFNDAAKETTILQAYQAFNSCSL